MKFTEFLETKQINIEDIDADIIICNKEEQTLTISSEIEEFANYFAWGEKNWINDWTNACIIQAIDYEKLYYLIEDEYDLSLISLYVDTPEEVDENYSDIDFTNWDIVDIRNRGW